MINVLHSSLLGKLSNIPLKHNLEGWQDWIQHRKDELVCHYVINKALYFTPLISFDSDVKWYSATSRVLVSCTDGLHHCTPQEVEQVSKGNSLYACTCAGMGTICYPSFSVSSNCFFKRPSRLYLNISSTFAIFFKGSSWNRPAHVELAQCESKH